MTYTYSILEISKAAYDEIKEKLERHGYQDQFHTYEKHGVVIDMHGIALAFKQDSYDDDYIIVSLTEDVKCGGHTMLGP